MKVNVKIIEKDFGRVIDFQYDPPPSLWKFKQERGLELLEQDIVDICNQYVGCLITKILKEQMRSEVENHINSYIFNGWLYVCDPSRIILV